MTPRIIEARPLSGFRLYVAFEDGRRGEVDLSQELWGPVFEPLKDPAVFATAQLDRELNTIRWPSGADLAPEFLYDAVEVQNTGS